jgi:nucleotide-binding universal stress UspA family protein
MAPSHRSSGALICFDGSHDAARAIATAGELLASRVATVLTVWEPVAVWAPYDPAAVFSAGLSRLASEDLGLDDITAEIAEENLQRGVALAGGAGFQATGRIESGKPWRTICAVAEELDVSAIVMGARGLSRVRSALLGSVSTEVLTHAGQPVLVIPPPGAHGVTEPAER